MYYLYVVESDHLTGHVLDILICRIEGAFRVSPLQSVTALFLFSVIDVLEEKINKGAGLYPLGRFFDFGPSQI